MDIARPRSVAKKRQIFRLIGGAAIIGAITGGTFLFADLKPAVPSVDRNSLWIGSVRQGPMDVQVRGLGELLPEQVVWIPAPVDGTVQQIVRNAGDAVKDNDILVVLRNPEIELSAQDAAWQVRQDEAAIADLKVKLESQKLDAQAALAELQSQYTEARLAADRDAELTRLNLKSQLESQLSLAKAKELQKRLSLQQQRLRISDQSIRAQLEEQEVTLARAKADYELKHKQVEQLAVRANTDGVVQETDIQVGQHVTAGTILEKVADNRTLKASLQIPETQMKDVHVGQSATIDTHNGVIPGRIIRIDPAAHNGTVTVDVKLLGSLPPGSRPELSVDGTIDIEQLNKVLYIDRPVNGSPYSTTTLFKLSPRGNTATRVSVRLGVASVNKIQVIDGLTVGNKVILSDMSQWDSQKEIRLVG
jgi:HlyD family secretion protein